MTHLGLRAGIIAGIMSLVGATVGCRGWQAHGDTYYARRVPAKRARQETTYRFGSPGPAWQPLSKKIKDVQVAWVNRNLAGFIELRAQCDEQGDSSLAQYTDHLSLDWTNWQVTETVEERLIGRAALRTVAQGNLDGVPRRSEFVVVKKNGCLFDLRYSTRPASFEQGRADFRKVVAGFRFPVGATP